MIGGAIVGVVGVAMAIGVGVYVLRTRQRRAAVANGLQDNKLWHEYELSDVEDITQIENATHYYPPTEVNAGTSLPGFGEAAQTL